MELAPKTIEQVLLSYKIKLKDLNCEIERLVKLKWDRSDMPRVPGNHDLNLSHLFFRFLGENNSELNSYIEKIEKSKINNFEQLFTKELKDDFLRVFTEIFRLYAYSKVGPFRKEFEKINFPSTEFDKVLEEFKNFLKNEFDLKITVPNLWEDNFREDEKKGEERIFKEYEKTTGVPHVFSSQIINMSDFEKDKKPGVVIDFSQIGLKSEKLGVDEKVKVILYSKI